MQPEPFASATLRGWVNSALEGLRHLHMVMKTAHNDIKPENLLLSDDRKTLVICDVGLAKRYDRTMQVCGTWAYMAPEQFKACYELSVAWAESEMLRDT